MVLHRRSAIETEFIKGNSEYLAKIDKKLLETLSVEGQVPRAIVIACSDSRVPVEIIFNELKPGTFFVIRVAGNIVSGPEVIGSIEFAVQQLKTPYIILLAHTECGVIKAAINQTTNNGPVGTLLGLVKFRSPDVNQAVIENLEQQYRNLLKIECVQQGIQDKVIEAYAMVYDLRTGKVGVHSRSGQVSS